MSIGGWKKTSNSSSWIGAHGQRPFLRPFYEIEQNCRAMQTRHWIREHLLIMDGVSSAVCEWRQMDSGSLFPLGSMRQLLSAYDERTRQPASASLRIVLVLPHARTHAPLIRHSDFTALRRLSANVSQQTSRLLSTSESSFSVYALLYRVL